MWPSRLRFFAWFLGGLAVCNALPWLGAQIHVVTRSPGLGVLLLFLMLALASGALLGLGYLLLSYDGVIGGFGFCLLAMFFLFYGGTLRARYESVRGPGLEVERPQDTAGKPVPSFVTVRRGEVLDWQRGCAMVGDPDDPDELCAAPLVSPDEIEWKRPPLIAVWDPKKLDPEGLKAPIKGTVARRSWSEDGWRLPLASLARRHGVSPGEPGWVLLWTDRTHEQMRAWHLRRLGFFHAIGSLVGLLLGVVAHWWVLVENKGTLAHQRR